MSNKGFNIVTIIFVVGKVILSVILCLFVIRMPMIYAQKKISYNEAAKAGIKNALEQETDHKVQRKIERVVERYPMEIVIRYNEELIYETLPNLEVIDGKGLINMHVVMEEANVVLTGPKGEYDIWYSIYKISDGEYIWRVFTYQAILVAIIVTISLGILLIIQYNLVRPIKKIKRTIKRLELYELDKIESSNDSLNSRLGIFAKKLKWKIQNYNKVQTRLEYEVEQEKGRLRHTVIVSRAFIHNLKTPLHQFFLENDEVAQDNRSGNRELSIWAKRNANKAEVVLNKINEILRLLDEKGAICVDSMNRVDLVELFLTVKQGFYGRLSLRELSVHVDVPQKLVVDVNETAMALTFDNLLSNAINYAVVGTEIACAIFERDTIITIVVENETTNENIERIERYGGSYELIGVKEGTCSSGNGLYLLREISSMYQGEFFIDIIGSRVRSGVRFKKQDKN
ncbi:MAG: hypothetical protein ACRC6X_01085 [Culicoidibacterales bacterium]